jgi:hypothetical protein
MQTHVLDKQTHTVLPSSGSLSPELGDARRCRAARLQHPASVGQRSHGGLASTKGHQLGWNSSREPPRCCGLGEESRPADEAFCRGHAAARVLPPTAMEPGFDSCVRSLVMG